ATIEVAAASADLHADIAANAQAGLGARDVIEAGAVNVADADIFSRLRLGDDDGVGGARTGDCDQSRSGADKKALDVHFLTSSQNQNSPSPQQTGNVFPINGLSRFSCRGANRRNSCRRAIAGAICPRSARAGACLQGWNRRVQAPTHAPLDAAGLLDSLSRKSGKRDAQPARLVKNVLPPARGSWCFCNSSFG